MILRVLAGRIGELVERQRGKPKKGQILWHRMCNRLGTGSLGRQK
jgi:hypothetical protein